MRAFVIESDPLRSGIIEPEYKVAIEELERGRAGRV